MRASAYLTAAVAHLAVLIAAGYAVAHGEATAGTVLASIMLIAALLLLVHELGGVFELWQSARVCQERVDQLMAGEPLHSAGAETTMLQAAAGEVRFERVAYLGILDGIDLVAPSGSVIAITGPNGAGKSTLLALVSRLIRPTQGRVLLDGQDVGGLARDSLRDAVGMVSTDLPLLRGTVEMNVRYRCPDAPAEEIDRVARLCGIEHLLAPAPDGKAQRLADRGRNLSLGERQRILLARALVGTPAVLLFDEAEANLDETLSHRIAALLDTYPGTVLMVTHRPSWMEKADQVWRLEHGRVAAAVDRVGERMPAAPRLHPVQAAE